MVTKEEEKQETSIVELYKKTLFFQFTELWFKWLSWLIGCYLLYIFGAQHELNAGILLFLISSCLAVYNIIRTSIDMAFNNIGAELPVPVRCLILLIPLLWLLAFFSVDLVDQYLH